MKETLARLVESYGVSGAEGPAREAIKSLLPPWAKPETDAAGNLILRVASKKPGSKAHALLFVAHSDEIGYAVESIADDGRLIVRSRGGGSLNFFAGHAILVHSAAGPKSGVLELPAGWDQPGFEWPRGQQVQATPLHIDVGARSAAQVAELGIKVGDTATIPKRYRPLLGTRANGRSFDDRVGSAALIAAAWALGPNLLDRDITFAWVTEEEVGLRGALAMAAAGHHPDYVFAVDTFVSSDSPLESKRFANAPIGEGFVIRAVDNSNIVPREEVEKLIRLARQHNVPVQHGVTGGGNDGAAFLRHGAVDIPISWPLRYSHSPGEVIDLRDAEALARIVELISRHW
jgi:putative aminopeptidase FrvX